MADQGIPTLVDGPQDAPDAKLSHRLIVELDSPPLAVAYRDRVGAAGVNGRLNVNAPDAQTYIAQLQAEQAAFVADMGSVLQDASVSTFINELGVAEQASYQIVFNGLAVDPGSADREEAKQKLARMPGVKAVYYDRAYETQLYTSTTLIGATTVWAEAGGAANAGKGVKVASMDGGLHKDAAMFDGTGWSYPAGYPADGLGLTANNNGKIIASRVYFRSWDPPAPGDENPWPGVAGTSHGTHTGSTAAGNCVDNVEYLGYNVGTMCGVAPGAWLMSYRVFYASVNGNESFYTAEGVAALEDIVADGADVLNNSWGEGPISEGGQFDPIDQALINAANAGIFVSMSNGNSGPNLGTSDH
ncbi:MAG: S8 family serine peptidase, partial [Caldilineaceae bacterium]